MAKEKVESYSPVYSHKPSDRVLEWLEKMSGKGSVIYIDESDVNIQSSKPSKELLSFLEGLDEFNLQSGTPPPPPPPTGHP